MTGLGVAGIIGVVRALDWDLIFQWIVGAVCVALCVFIGYRVNKKIESVRDPNRRAYNRTAFLPERCR